MAKIIKMTDLDLKGKRVLIRCDLNVPIKDGKVTSDKRIVATLPTIKKALAQGARVMVTSHLGRPEEGVYSEEFSLKPVADYLQGSLPDVKVRLVKDYLDGVEVAAGELVVLDYKTDRVETEEELAKRYRVQLDWYEKALRQITEKKVKEKWIWSFALSTAAVQWVYAFLASLLGTSMRQNVGMMSICPTS